MLHSISCTGAQRDTKGRRERCLLGETLLPAKKPALLYLSILPQQDRMRGGRDNKVRQGMKEELVETKGMAEGRDAMEMQVRKQGREVKQYCGKKNENTKRRKKQGKKRAQREKENWQFVAQL